MNWYQVALWTMIFLKSGAFLVFVWWWMFKRATKPYVRPQDVVVDDTPYDENLTMEEVMKNHGIVRTEHAEMQCITQNGIEESGAQFIGHFIRFLGGYLGVRYFVAFIIG
nr:hypothetical protein [Serratia marcescens]